MRLRFGELVSALFLSLLLLIVLDIFSTTIVPSLGIAHLTLNFTILFVLFLNFYVDHSLMAVVILISQYVHSLFTVESWAYGTFTGILTGFVLSQLKEVVDFDSPLITSLICFFYQLLWFGVISLLIYLKGSTHYPFFHSLWQYLLSALMLSLFGPFFFMILKKIWKVGRQDSHGDQVHV
jgi:hypothetical protein